MQKETKNINYSIKHEIVSLPSFQRWRFSYCINKFNNWPLTKQNVIYKAKSKIVNQDLYQPHLKKIIIGLVSLSKVKLKTISTTFKKTIVPLWQIINHIRKSQHSRFIHKMQHFHTFYFYIIKLQYEPGSILSTVNMDGN